MKINLKKIPYYILFVLMLYMPFHYWICELLIRNTSLDNIVRDIFIVFVFFAIAISSKILIYQEGAMIIFNCIILTFFALASYSINSYANTFNILRNYLMPMVLCIACMNMYITIQDLRKLMRYWIIELGIIGVYGIIQAFVIGDQFIINMGYPSLNGCLSSSYYINGFYGFQRSVGTFVSPHSLGSVLAIALGTLLFSKFNFKLKHRNLWVIVLLIGLVGTISRASILGLLLVALLNAFRGAQKNRQPRILKLLGIFLCFFSFCILLIYIFLITCC